MVAELSLQEAGQASQAQCHFKQLKTDFWSAKCRKTLTEAINPQNTKEHWYFFNSLKNSYSSWIKCFKPDNVKPILTLSVVSGGLNFSDWEHQWVSTYCLRITDASCIRREVRNQGHSLEPLQGSPLTHLLSLLSHHASFRGASGLAKNAKIPLNGPQSYCGKKNCWVSTEQQWPA